jgi:hypothetical protein
MEDPREILESVASNNSHVEILQYRRLLGSTDIDTAKSLFYAAQSGVQLRQIRIVLNEGEAMIESGLLHFMKGAISLENKIGGLGGLAKKMLANALTNETTFKPTYKGKGEIWLEPTFGHFLGNYSGLNQYFPRNALFLPPSGEGIARFALEKWMA